MGLISKAFGLFRRAMASAERDRFEDRFQTIDKKLDHCDERLDNVEINQAAQNEKLSAIHQVTLANNEALEQKLNLSTVNAEMVRQIVDARMTAFQDSLQGIKGLIEQVIRRDCNL